MVKKRTRQVATIQQQLTFQEFSVSTHVPITICLTQAGLAKRKRPKSMEYKEKRGEYSPRFLRDSEGFQRFYSALTFLITDAASMPKCASNSSALPERAGRHGQFVDLDAFNAEFAGNRVTQAAFGIMVFHGDDRVVGLFRRGLDHLLRQRLDAVGVNHGDADAFVLKGVGGLERLEEGDAGGNHRGLVARDWRRTFAPPIGNCRRCYK